MPLQAQQGVVARHAQAVIPHAHQAAPAGLDFHHHPAGLGVQRILDQFFDHTGGALDDLAGGDLVGHLLRQQADAVHGVAGAGPERDAAAAASGGRRGRPKENTAPPSGRFRAAIQPP